MGLEKAGGFDTNPVLLRFRLAPKSGPTDQDW